MKMKRNKKNEKGIIAMGKEHYALPVEHEIGLQKLGRTWWSHPISIIVLTVFMSLLDMLVLYDILDQAMTQSEYMGKLVSFGIALVLNMIPLLIARFVRHAMYKTERLAVVWAIVSTGAFLILYIGTVWLRFAYQDNYGASDLAQLTNEVAVNSMTDAAALQHDPKGLAVVVLLSLEPLATSLINFGLAYISNDPLKKRIDRLRVRKYELLEAQSDLQAYLKTIEDSEDRYNKLLALDKERKEASKQEIHSRCDLMKAQARVYLAAAFAFLEGVM